MCLLNSQVLAVKFGCWSALEIALHGLTSEPIQQGEQQGSLRPLPIPMQITVLVPGVQPLPEINPTLDPPSDPASRSISGVTPVRNQTIG